MKGVCCFGARDFSSTSGLPSLHLSPSAPRQRARGKRMEMPADRPRVGLLYDERMCRHSTPNGEPHPESPDRIRAIWRKLDSGGIPQRCVVLEAEEAEDEHIALVHTKKHIDLVRKIGSKDYDARWRNGVASKFNSIYLNEGSSESAFLAAGSVIQVTEKVAKGELSSAIAIVRPPGHHAESGEAMGFCLFNNVAIAASFLLNERPELGIKKILIVDWDVHHGNGTQKMFWNDPRVLYFSVHRFDFGSFYPVGGYGYHTMIGEGAGAGYNINVPWEHGQCGDADYLAAWDHILLPVAEAFNPDIILISGGFDAAIGDPLGGCCITPYGYSVMMNKLMRFARGKIMMALEGGYNLNSLAESVLACAKALLGEPPATSSSVDQPFESTLRVILEVRRELSPFWSALTLELPNNVLVHSKKALPIELQLSSGSDSDGEATEGIPDLSESLGLESEGNAVDDVMVPLSKLSVHEVGQGNEIPSNRSSSSDQLPLPDQVIGMPVPWRSVLSKTYIWYGSYGSNMWTPRFLCYIRGGQVEGMLNPCSGSKDKSLPKDITWKTVPHRLFFARSSTKTWGTGGVAFLHPEANINVTSYICLYMITLEQFNDVLLQENNALQEFGSPFFDLSALKFVKENRSISIDAFKGGWYSNVLYLGEMDDVAILTMTCSVTDIDGFKSGKLPMLAPSSGYMNTLVKGLVEGKQLSEKEAIDYIRSATL